jgi:hypothetical protein
MLDHINMGSQEGQNAIKTWEKQSPSQPKLKIRVHKDAKTLNARYKDSESQQKMENFLQ